jgi:hypothetical protein
MQPKAHALSLPRFTMPHLLRLIVTVFCIVAASSTSVAQGTYPSAT